MTEATYFAQHMPGNSSKEEFMTKFEKAMSASFDPTMLKGETELIGKFFEQALIKKFGSHGSHKINEHFMSLNTTGDTAQQRQDAMCKMFRCWFEDPKSCLYADLEGEHVGPSLLSTKEQDQLGSRMMEAGTRDCCELAAEYPKKIDLVIVDGDFSPSSTTHLLEIAGDEGFPGYHIDCADRIGILGGEATNRIQHSHSPWFLPNQFWARASR